MVAAARQRANQQREGLQGGLRAARSARRQRRLMDRLGRVEVNYVAYIGQ